MTWLAWLDALLPTLREGDLHVHRETAKRIKREGGDALWLNPFPVEMLGVYRGRKVWLGPLIPPGAVFVHEGRFDLGDLREGIERLHWPAPPKAHTWTKEWVNGGPVGEEDFWVCSTCGASGGPVGWKESGEPPSFSPFLAGPAFPLTDHCDLAAALVENFKVVAV